MYLRKQKTINTFRYFSPITFSSSKLQPTQKTILLLLGSPTSRRLSVLNLTFQLCHRPPKSY